MHKLPTGISLTELLATGAGMSLPPFPSTSGDKPADLHVYTIEECQNCGQKTKRDFKVGDFVLGDVGSCEKCQGKKTIALIYGEKALKKTGKQGSRPR
jgi:hypothetical protein